MEIKFKGKKSFEGRRGDMTLTGLDEEGEWVLVEGPEGRCRIMHYSCPSIVKSLFASYSKPNDETRAFNAYTGAEFEHVKKPGLNDSCGHCGAEIPEGIRMLIKLRRYGRGLR